VAIRVLKALSKFAKKPLFLLAFAIRYVVYILSRDKLKRWFNRVAALETQEVTAARRLTSGVKLIIFSWLPAGREIPRKYILFPLLFY
jgi:hypothetical protein